MPGEDSEAAGGPAVRIVADDGDASPPCPRSAQPSPPASWALSPAPDGSAQGGGLTSGHDICRARSAPDQRSGRLLVRCPDPGFYRSEFRSTEDMMMGSRYNVRDFTDDFSAMDPSQFHFYDFGIQDFLVMKRHTTVELDDEPEGMQQGDYNQGMSISPGPYLSDSDLSVTSIELSPEQVLWEKKLTEEASILKNCLLRRGRRQTNSSHEVGRGRVRVLSRRATENCFGLQTNAASKKVLIRPVSVTELGRQGDEGESCRLDIGEDCGSGCSLSSG
ncbi:uncharacterized protein LOC119110501 [Pollicipes pollicipes]|uniref:uncharacterized protein LOC119110501 n=1 Tax=Pollicipes pollicipes TaxID=41117 RepID=UPI0018852CC4|nr:uncharacterized protein LOC119110501 [Pollicipes pollicipes]